MPKAPTLAELLVGVDIVTEASKFSEIMSRRLDSSSIEILPNASSTAMSHGSSLLCPQVQRCAVPRKPRPGNIITPSLF